MKFNFLTDCEIFFTLKFSKFVQNIKTLESFGKFLLIFLYSLELLQINEKNKLIFLFSVERARLYQINIFLFSKSFLSDIRKKNN